MKSISPALWIVASVALAGSVLAADQEGFAGISHEELKAALASKSVTLLDCNGAESYAQGHIPGALEFHSAKQNLSAKLPEDKKALIVAYCGGVKCGAWRAGAAAAAALGYTNVKHYAPGIQGWRAAGENVETTGATKAKGGCCGGE